MKEVTYGSLAVGSTFEYGGQTYQKTVKVRVSCCKFHNACTVGGVNSMKHAFKDETIVLVKDNSNGETT